MGIREMDQKWRVSMIAVKSIRMDMLDEPIGLEKCLSSDEY